MDPDVGAGWATEELGRLSRAVAAGDLDEAARALADGADPNRAGPRMLNRVAIDGSAEMARLLLARGAHLDRTSPEGWTALTFADAWGNDAVAAVLEAAGADPAQRTIHGFTELHRAARLGDLEVLERALSEHGADAVDATGDTALHEAIEQRNSAAVDLLLAAGADPNVHDPSWSTLTSAVYQDTVGDQDTDYTRQLLAAGAEANPVGTPPMVMTINQAGARPELIGVLLGAGADIHAVDPRDGSTLLHDVAAFYDEPDLVTTVLGSGAAVELRDHRGRTPLHLAADAAHPSVAAALLDAGADPDALDADGHRPVDLIETNHRIVSPERMAATRTVLTRS